MTRVKHRLYRVIRDKYDEPYRIYRKLNCNYKLTRTDITNKLMPGMPYYVAFGFLYTSTELEEILSTPLFISVKKVS